MSEDIEIPDGLYREARRRLLVNEPLRAMALEADASVSVFTQGEVTALESMGLSTQPWVGRSDEDPLARSVADYMALLETSLKTSEAAAYLRVDASRIRQRLRERSLYGIEYDGERRLPRFQFERHHIVPGLADVLAALPAALNPLDVVEWFLSPDPDLESSDQDAPLSPRDWLLRGLAVNAVVALARGFE